MPSPLTEMAKGTGVSVGGRGVALGGRGVALASTAGRFGMPPEQAVRASKNIINVRFKVTIPPIIPETVSLIARLLVHFPDDAQPIQGQPGGNVLDDRSLFGYNLRQTTGGDHFHLWPKLSSKALHHAFHHAHVTK